MSFELRQATRTHVKPLIALYSESGCGKTHTALILARGFVGPTGRIGQIDSESGRGALYADILPGGYETLELRDPFTPQRYIEAMEVVERSGVQIGIIDSGSHEWEGIGGVLDMSAEIEERSGKTGLHCWKGPKLAHNFWIRKLLQSPLPWIVCLRAKYKSRQGKNEAGKTVICKDEKTTPITADDFIFEATAKMELLADHSVVDLRCNHPGLYKCFPGPKDGPIVFEHGKALALWCAAGGASSVGGTTLPPALSQPPAVAPSAPKPKLTEAEKKARWKARLIEAGGGHESYALEYAVEEGIILDTETLDDWPVDKQPKTAAQVETILTKIRLKAGLIVTEPDKDPVKETLP